jgi:ABC-type multidrug transport system fused ATPase/permease subunit
MARPSLNSGAPLTQEGQRAKISLQSLKQLKWILQHLSPHRWLFTSGLLFLIIGSGVSLMFPWFIGKLTDLVNGKSIAPWLGGLYGLLGWLIAVFGIQAFLSFFRVLFFVRIGERVLYDIRSKVYENLIAQPISFFQDQKVGELNSRVTLDLSYIQDTITTTSAELIRQFLVIIGGVIFLFTQTSTKLTLIMLGVFPVLIALAIFFGVFIRKMARKAQQKMADSQAVLDESMQNISTVKAFGNEWYEIQRFRDNLSEVVRFGIRGGLFRAMFSSFIILVVFGAIIGIIFLGFLEVQKGNLSLGSLISFITYSAMVGASMGSLSTLISDFQRAIGASERVFEWMNQAGEEIKKPSSGFEAKGKVVFEDVTFSYPTRKNQIVFNKINLELLPQETYGVVGKSGAGKSTLAQILLRFFEIDSGKIKWDGIDFMEIPLVDLRRSLAIVPQEVLLFHGTISENIAYGKPGCSNEEVLDAARRAHVLEFATTLPDGLETMIGEKGAKLSGGQKQRIAIARALIKKPVLLIFDEATSALDNESEKMVQKTIAELKGTCTMLIIAHRPSTLEVCSKLIHIQGNGELQVVENSGDLTNLLASLKKVQ